MQGTRSTLSTLWLFATLNYLYCDVVALMNPELLRQFMAGRIGGFEISQGFLLAAAVLVEIPISMVLLSRILRGRSNMVTNVAAGVVMTVAQLLSLIVQVPPLYYIFFSVIEITCTAFIVWYAWKWASAEHSLSASAQLGSPTAVSPQTLG